MYEHKIYSLNISPSNSVTFIVPVVRNSVSCINITFVNSISSPVSDFIWDNASVIFSALNISLADVSLDALGMPKPKGMWWKTYYRLQERAQAAERRSDDGFMVMARRLVKVG